MIIRYKLDQMIRREWIEQAYTGREEGCRCGCHGTYFDKGQMGFTRALNKAFKLNPIVALCDTDSEVNTECLKARKATAADGQPNAYAFTHNGRIEWVDLVLEGSYPYLKTITLYTTK